MGSNCYTEDDFDKALTGKTSGLRFVEAHTDRMDGPACTPIALMPLAIR